MLSLFIFIHIAQATSRQGSLDKGILFKEETKIMLIENLSNVQFLLPIPRFIMMVEDHYLEGLENDKKFPWRNNSLLIPESHEKKHETLSPMPQSTHNSIDNYEQVKFERKENY